MRQRLYRLVLLTVTTLLLTPLALAAEEGVPAPQDDPAGGLAGICQQPPALDFENPEPQPLSCTAQFTCPDSTVISCTHPTMCFVNPDICSIRCGTSEVHKCCNWPPGCDEPCDYCECLTWGTWSQEDCLVAYCEGFGGPD